MHRLTPHIIYQRSKVDIIALVAFVMATLLQAIALATPGWARTPDVLVGLFHYCGKLTLDHRTSSMRQCEYVPGMGDVETLHIVQAMTVIGVLLSGVSTILFVLHMWMITQYEKITATVIIVCLSLGMMSVLCCVSSSVVFGTMTRHAYPKIDMDINQFEFYYSFGMYLSGGALLFLVEVLVFARVRTLTRMLLV